ncbi:MAG: hypothetical protein COA79_25710 [Planctomycetota bacterium]|nr:MAG: hypothetical protein COA79_25710 [Planctomycetota bacterium]
MKIIYLVIIVLIFVSIIGITFFIQNEPKRFQIKNEHFLPIKLFDGKQVNEVEKVIISLIKLKRYSIKKSEYSLKITFIDKSKCYKFWREIEIKKINLNDKTHPIDKNGKWCWFLYGHHKREITFYLHHYFSSTPRETEKQIELIRESLFK